MKKRKCGGSFLVVKFSHIKMLVLFGLLLLALSLPMLEGQALASVFLGNKRLIPVYCVENDKKEVAITFDACWGSDKTRGILNTLKEYDVTATFFLVGMWVDKNEDLVRLIDEQGLEIGTHSNTHPDMTKLSTSEIDLELNTSINKITAITGKSVKVFRPPYGAYNNALITTATSLGLTTIQWNVDSLDWKGISAEKICSNVIKKVDSGSIILCHNNADNILPALPTIITTLKSRGYTFVRVSELLLKDNCEINHAGKQVKLKN